MSDIYMGEKNEIREFFGFDASELVKEYWPEICRHAWVKKMVGFNNNPVHNQLDFINRLVQAGVSAPDSAIEAPSLTVNPIRLEIQKLIEEIKADQLNEIKTYSIVINWHDNDSEEGTYGSTVRARSTEDAEALVRLQMISDDQFENDREADEPTYGSVVDFSLGASWMSSDLESSIRRILECDNIDEVKKIATSAIQPFNNFPIAHEVIDEYLKERKHAQNAAPEALKM